LTLRNGVYVITGIMASGKSTVAELLAAQFDRGVHVRGDVFRKMIVSGRVDMTPEYTPGALEQLMLRYNMAAKVADMYYRAGFSVVVQDTYLGASVSSFLQEFESRPLFFITLNPSVEAVMQREQQRQKTGYTEWEVQSLHDVLNNENPRVGFWLDSSQMTPEQTLAEIVERAVSRARIA